MGLSSEWKQGEADRQSRPVFSLHMAVLVQDRELREPPPHLLGTPGALSAAGRGSCLPPRPAPKLRAKAGTGLGASTLRGRSGLARPGLIELVGSQGPGAGGAHGDSLVPVTVVGSAVPHVTRRAPSLARVEGGQKDP